MTRLASPAWALALLLAAALCMSYLAPADAASPVLCGNGQYKSGGSCHSCTSQHTDLAVCLATVAPLCTSCMPTLTPMLLRQLQAKLGATSPGLTSTLSMAAAPCTRTGACGVCCVLTVCADVSPRHPAEQARATSALRANINPAPASPHAATAAPADTRVPRARPAATRAARATTAPAAPVVAPSAPLASTAPAPPTAAADAAATATPAGTVERARPARHAPATAPRDTTAPPAPARTPLSARLAATVAPARHLRRALGHATPGDTAVWGRRALRALVRARLATTAPRAPAAPSNTPVAVTSTIALAARGIPSPALTTQLVRPAVAPGRPSAPRATTATVARVISALPVATAVRRDWQAVTAAGLARQGTSAPRAPRPPPTPCVVPTKPSHARTSARPVRRRPSSWATTTTWAPRRLVVALRLGR